jgi:hypothetical protein
MRTTTSTHPAPGGQIRKGRYLSLLSAAALALGMAGTGLLAASASTLQVPTARVLDVSVTERNADGLSAVVRVQLSAVPRQLVKVDYKTVAVTAKAPADFRARSGTLTWRAGQARTKTISVPIRGDLLDEATETFNVRISNPYRVGITDALGVVRIVDNDPLPTISTTDVEAYEGSGGASDLSWPVSLSAVSGRQVRVAYSITPGSAAYNTDYTVTPTTGTLTFPPGVRTRNVTISVLGDTTDEAAETVNVSLLSPVNAVLATHSAVATIRDDDGPGIVISNSPVASEPGTATFTVSVPDPGSPETVTVDYATANGTATAPGDYQARSGTLTFAPYETSKTITVPVVADTVDEVDEYFFVNLGNPSGGAQLGDPQGYAYIEDNDGPAVSINNPPAPVEGSSAVFTVSLSAASPQPVSVAVSTGNGTAVAPDDYTATSGTLVFAPGQTSRTVLVATTNDGVVEEDEYFYLNLSSPVDATLADSSGYVFINGNATMDKATYLGSFRGDTGGDYAVKSSSIVFGDTDMYQFVIRESIFALWDDDLVLHTTLVIPDNGGDLDLCLYNASGTQLACSTNGGTTDEVLSYGWDDSSSTDTRIFYVKVYGFAGATSNYDLRVGR